MARKEFADWKFCLSYLFFSPHTCYFFWSGMPPMALTAFSRWNLTVLSCLLQSIRLCYITGWRRKPCPGLSLRLCLRWLSMDHCLSQYPWPIGWPIAHAVRMGYACFVTLDTVPWPQIQAAWRCDNQWRKCLIECCSLVGALSGRFGFHGFKWAEELYPYPYYYKSSIDLVDLIPLQVVGLVWPAVMLRFWAITVYKVFLANATTFGLSNAAQCVLCCCSTGSGDKKAVPEISFFSIIPNSS